MKKYFGVLALFLMTFVPGILLGANLQGFVIVNQTSDTAAKAKTDAMNFARRQILSDVLSKYTDIASFRELLADTSDNALVDLIESTSVSNEQISANSYAANIVMQIDSGSVRNWLTSNGVQNLVPSGESTEKFSMFIVVPNGVYDWGELKKIARDAGVEIEPVVIIGNQIYAKMSQNYRTRFTAGLPTMGWKYADNNGVLQIWK